MQGLLSYPEVCSSFVGGRFAHLQDPKKHLARVPASTNSSGIYRPVFLHHSCIFQNLNLRFFQEITLLGCPIEKVKEVCGFRMKT